MSLPNARSTQTCLYCGNNPTNHAIAWIDGLISAFDAGRSDSLLKSRFGRVMGYLTDGILAVFLAMARLMRIARFEGDVAKARFYIS